MDDQTSAGLDGKNRRTRREHRQQSDVSTHL